MKNKKIDYLKAISNINITTIMKDGDRGNLYRGKVSDKKLDSYIDIVKKRIKEADKLIE